jgi:hypothetical protein
MVQKLTPKQKSRIQSIEIRFLGKTEGKTRQGRIRNSTFKENLKIKATLQAVKERQMRWFGHINRMGDEKQDFQEQKERTTQKNLGRKN